MKNKKKRNICVALLRKTKRKYYKDLRLSDLTTTKFFGKLSNHCLQIKSREKVK